MEFVALSNFHAMGRVLRSHHRSVLALTTQPQFMKVLNKKVGIIINGWNSDRPQRKTRNIMAEIKSLYTIFGRCNSANVLHDIQVIHKYIGTMQ